jgi:hypothetical protein
MGARVEAEVEISLVMVQKNVVCVCMCVCLYVAKERRGWGCCTRWRELWC